MRAAPGRGMQGPRPPGFPWLSFCCALLAVHAVLHLPGMFGFPPGGLLSRFVAICSAVLLGVVAVGLRRGEAWVGRAMELCIGLWVLKLVAGNLEVLGWAFRTGLWLRVGIMVGILYLPVHYVKRKLRQWYGPAMPPAPPPPAPLPAAPFTRV